MGGNRAPAVLKDLRTWIAAAIVAPSAVTFFSSLILNNAVNAINTRAFPPHADIQGMLTSKQLAVKQLRVEIDGGAFTFSAADGSFTFADVVRGVYHLSVRDGHTIICEDCTSIDVSPSAVGSSIQVQVNLDGSPKSSAVSSSFAPALHQARAPIGLRFREDFCTQNLRVGCITSRLAASSSVLSRTRAVTYYLPAQFQPSVVTRSTVKNRFSLELKASDSFVVAAKVLFKNGQVKDTAAEISLSLLSGGVGVTRSPFRPAPPVALSQLH